MSEKKLFYGSSFVLLFLSFVFGIISPLSLSAEQRLVDRLASKVSEYEGIVGTHLNRLNSCRSHCVSQCRTSCKRECESRCVSDRGCDCSNEDCSHCTNEMCDGGSCSANKQKYNELKNHLENYKTQLAKLREQEGGSSGEPEDDEEPEEGADNKDDDQRPGNNMAGSSESTIDQVRRGKDKMDIYTIMGAATTGFLLAKAKACCPNRGCNMCGTYLAMAAAAGIATGKMANQRESFRDTEKGLCETTSDALGCTPDDNPGGGDDSTGPPAPELPPSCTLIPESQCENVWNIINDPNDGKDNPPDSCSPGDTACLTGGTPGMPFRISTGLKKIFEPPGGWPKGTFTGNKDFSYENLSPEAKKHVDSQLAKLNKMNKGFMDKALGDDAGFNLGGGYGSGDDETDTESGLGGIGKALTGKGDTASFTGGEGDRSVSSSDLDDTIGGTAGRKSNLAQQMKQMLKKFYGEGGKDPLAEKSVSLGSDVVGVVEDNIFMMIHRRHRTMDGQNYFIRDAF